MNNVNTNPDDIKAVLERGTKEIIHHDELYQKMTSGKKLRIKLGIDPTSPNLHLGRSVPLLKLRDFQNLGHQVVLIVGDFTGVIGDTSDKDSERPMLSEEEIEKNKASYFDQIGKIIDLDKAELRYNSDWLKPLNYRDIGEQANIFSVADFIARDNIKRRLDAGTRVSLREVLYPLMQGYDSVAIKADVEIGGTDQRFNLLAGRHMQPHFHQEAQSIVMLPLVNGLDGRKMSSSWGNTINFNDEPLDMYGKVMSMSDDLLSDYFTFFTRIPLDEIQGYEKEMQSGENPMTIKHKLAYTIVQMYHGNDLAGKAQKSWTQTFSKSGIPDQIEEVKISNNDKALSDTLIKSNVVSSKTEFRRLLEAGAIRIYLQEELISLTTDEAPVKGSIVKVGKKKFVKLT